MSSNIFSVKDTCSFLEARDNFTLLTHAQPDGDTIGSAYALAYALKLKGKRVRVLCGDHIPSKFKYIMNSLKPDNDACDTVIALDVADTKLLGSLEDEYKDIIELCIDHHVSNREYAKNLLLDPTASATCEVVYHVIKGLDVPFTKHILDGIYTGIITDSGCFKYSNCTATTHRIAAELIDLGVDYAEINRVMFDTKSRGRIKIEAAVMDNMEFAFGGRVALIAVTQKMIKEAGCTTSDLDGINTLSRIIEGVMVGVTLREKEGGKYKVSLRTNAPIDATKICSEFGGGGHPRAAGCELECSLEEAKARIIPVVKAALEENGCLI